MDYSLLLVAEWVLLEHNINKSEMILPKDMGRNIISNTRTYEDGRIFRQNYHIGVIDFLQDWNLGKKMESLSKKTLLCLKGKKSNDISAIPPDEYQKRFVSFIGK